MKKKDIIEGNKLIAEFLGWKNPEGTVYETSHSRPYLAVDSSIYETNRYRISEFKFNSSWDWLMPVVIKAIEATYALDDDEYEYFNDSYFFFDDISLYDTSVEEIYEEIINFLKSYGKRKVR